MSKLRFKPGDLALVTKSYTTGKVGVVAEVESFSQSIGDYMITVVGIPGPFGGKWGADDDQLMPLKGDEDQFKQEHREELTA